MRVKGFFRLLLLPFLAAAARAGDVEPFAFAVISDPHLGARGSAENFAKFVEEANRLGVAFTIACGDLTETGSEAEWARLAEIAKGLKAPFHPVLGNHDSRWAGDGKRPLERHFGIERPYRAFVHGGVRFVLLDSSIVGAAHGGIDRTQLDWLVSDLGNRSGASWVVAALHHPPFPGGEATYLANEYPLLQTFESEGGRLVLSGHGHSHRRWSSGRVEILMTSNLYAEKEPRWRRIRVEKDRFVLETRTLGSDAPTEEEPVLFRGAGDALDRPRRPPPGDRPPVEDWNRTSPASSLRGVAASGGRLFLAGTEGVLAVHEDVRGAQVETIPLDGPCYSSPVIAGERVVVGTETGTVSAFRVSDLSKSWEASVGGAVTMTPAADEHRLFVGSGDGTLHALALADGRAIWSQKGGRHFGPPAAANDRVFAGNWDGHVYAFAAPDGRPLWKRKVHDSFYFAPGTSRPAIAGDLVVVTFATPTRPTDAPSVLALRVTDGEVAWSLRISAGYCSPLVLGGLVVFTTADGKVVAVERASGRVKWERAIGGSCYDSSPVACPGGLAVCTAEGELVFLDGDGKERGRKRAGGRWQFATPVCVGERLYLPDAFERSLRSIVVP